MIPSYSIVPAILWSQRFDDPQLFDDPKLFDDPQLFDDQLEVWTLIIDKVYGDTFISDGLVYNWDKLTIRNNQQLFHSQRMDLSCKYVRDIKQLK